MMLIQLVTMVVFAEISEQTPVPQSDATIHVYLRHQNLNWLRKELARVSSPRSIHPYPSSQHIRKKIAATPARRARVLTWLRTEAARLNTCQSLSVEYCIIRNALILQAPLDCIAHLRQGLDSPPESVEIDIHFVSTPGRNGVRKLRTKIGNGFPGAPVTPPVIWKRYGLESELPAQTSAAPGLGSQAVAEFEEAYFFPSDTLNFQKNYSVPTNAPIIRGPNRPQQGYLGEASLDVEYITSVTRTTPIKTIVWSIDHNLGFDLLSWAHNVSASSDPGLVHSLSWGSPEHLLEQDWMQRVDVELMVLGTMGITVISASGDNGPNNAGSLQCKNWSPTFPSSSPHVTSVGGTFAMSDANDEQCWSSSGGGFSTIFGRPSYQAEAVDQYLKQTSLPSSKLFNSSGRATPDVSALSTNYQILVQNFTGPISGTSAATPTFAAMISLINSIRLQKGGKSLGLINPSLYACQDIGFDVTQGKSKSDGICEAGWTATIGYDACSGLGSPLWSRLLDCLS